MKINLKAILVSFLMLGSAFSLASGPSGEAREAAKSPTPEPKTMAAPAQPGLFRLDHYKVYVIDRQQVEFKVGLRGQFDTDTRDAKLVYYTRHLNPVDKNNEGIIDKHAHLSWYDIRAEPEPVRKVAIRNQFGLQTIKIKDPVALLVPTEKREPGSQFPEKLDHYKVYEVVYGEPVFKDVYLRDQFGEETNIAQKPVYFAVPVLKKHNNQVFPIINDQDHLIFYTLEPREINEFRPVRDQFGLKEMKTLYSELLGVPSLKLDWESE